MSEVKPQIFYSFHYEKDCVRAQQIRNIGVVTGNEPVSPNEWEEVRRKGDEAIKRWIDENLKYRSCLVVLVGEETASRKWVKYEIQKAWEKGMGVVGIYIHNLKDFQGNTSKKGSNPFEQFKIGGAPMSSVVRCYNPNSFSPNKDIENNIKKLVEEAIDIRNQYK